MIRLDAEHEIQTMDVVSFTDVSKVCPVPVGWIAQKVGLKPGNTPIVVERPENRSEYLALIGYWTTELQRLKLRKLDIRDVDECASVRMQMDELSDCIDYAVERFLSLNNTLE